MNREIRFRIPRERAGEALVEFLLQRFPYHDRDGWLLRIREGRVRLNGRKADADRILAEGDQLEYVAWDIPEPKVDLHVEVLFEDRDLMVVNKPGNLPCHPGGRFFNHTLWAILKQQYRIESPAIVNRLDRETSGVVVVAKTPEAAKKCRSQFAGHRAQKRYVVFVEGEFPETLEAKGYIVEDRHAEVRKKQLFMPAESAPEGDTVEHDGVWAETRFRRIARHGPVSEIEVIPKTGRLHQVRATLHGLGYPVVGDKLYGVDPGIFARFCAGTMTDEDRSKMRLDRQALHAAGLHFCHPRNGKPLAFDVPLPPDMAGLLPGLKGPSQG